MKMPRQVLINNQRYAQLAGCKYDDWEIGVGPIYYSRTHMVVNQFPLLKPGVLVTSFSDACVTQDMANQLPDKVHWFSNNVMCDHPRVTALPIGCVYNMEREAVLLSEMSISPQRDKLLYVNFTQAIPRDPNPRVGLYAKFRWGTVKGGSGFASVAAAEFYRDLHTHHYCLSPHGAGPDCHRHWEAMLLGCIPIVLACKANEILDDLPALRVASWDHVTRDCLERILPELTNRPYDRSKLYLGYWEALIRSKLC